MKLVNEFTVEAPLEQTWETLLDVERVASCLPGASIEPIGEDGAYRGSLRIKVGPVSMAYGGTVRLAEVDADAHVASFEARAKETRGTGTAAAVIRNSLEPAGDGTRVKVETDLDVTGRAAQFGRGLMEDVATKMLGQFSGQLQQLVLEGPQAPAPAPAEAVASRGPTGGTPQPGPGAAGEDDVLDLGAALIGGPKARIAAAGVGVTLLAALIGLLLRSRRRGLTVNVKYRV